MELGIGSANDVFVLDDFLPYDIMQEMYEYMCRDDNMWSFSKYTTTLSEKFKAIVAASNIDDKGQLVHAVMIRSNTKVETLPPFIKKLAEFLSRTLGSTSLYRVKFNKLKVRNVDPLAFNIPHCDSATAGYWSMVVYMNQSVGDTVMFKETRQVAEETQVLNEQQRVSPKKGRVVLFPSRLMHASSSPWAGDEDRAVANIIFSVV